MITRNNSRNIALALLIAFAFLNASLSSVAPNAFAAAREPVRAGPAGPVRSGRRGSRSPGGGCWQDRAGRSVPRCAPANHVGPAAGPGLRAGWSAGPAVGGALNRARRRRFRPTVRPWPPARRTMRKVGAAAALLGLMLLGAAAGAFVFRAQLTRAIATWKAPPASPPDPAVSVPPPIQALPPGADQSPDSRGRQ